jgi:phytoene dehydrogenase-like protein
MRAGTAIIIGAGHNGLVCAFYLARAGWRVTMLERRAVVGGAAVTEEFYPGFRNSTASYTVSLLQPKVIRDMALARHGLTIVERQVHNFLPLNDREYLAGAVAPEVAKFSVKDAAALPAYTARLQPVCDFVRQLMLQAPPNVTEAGWISALPDLARGAAMGRQLSALPMTARRDLLALLAQSAGDWLDGWFESDPIKALFGFDAIVGNYASPYTPGSAYVLLHHLFGEVNGKRGAWGHAIGGMGAITAAMAAAARELGTEIRTGCDVREILIEHDRAVGVTTATGETLRADVVVSNLNPKLLLEMVPPDALADDFRERLRRYRCASGTFRMNVALAELPRFACLPAPGPHLTAGIIMAPSLAYMERAYDDARRQGWSQQPVIEMLIPSVVDDSLAPAGRHVASLFCQHVAPVLPNGDWATQRDVVARHMIDTVDGFAPGFAAAVLGYEALTPADLEHRFGLIGGDIMHGNLTLDQMFSARPVLGAGSYRLPVAGLYLCGSGSHPGGGVSGAPGHNAARRIVDDARFAFGRPR